MAAPSSSTTRPSASLEPPAPDLASAELLVRAIADSLLVSSKKSPDDAVLGLDALGSFTPFTTAANLARILIVGERQRRNEHGGQALDTNAIVMAGRLQQLFSTALRREGQSPLLQYRPLLAADARRFRRSDARPRRAGSILDKSSGPRAGEGEGSSRHHLLALKLAFSCLHGQRHGRHVRNALELAIICVRSSLATQRCALTACWAQQLSKGLTKHPDVISARHLGRKRPVGSGEGTLPTRCEVLDGSNPPSFPRQDRDLADTSTGHRGGEYTRRSDLQSARGIGPVCGMQIGHRRPDSTSAHRRTIRFARR